MFYTGYLITQASRDKIFEAFPPKYLKIVCHHITESFNVPADTPAPEIPTSVQVIGHVDSGDGVEGLLVAVNGNTVRPNGGHYHITLSLDTKRLAYETNKYIKNAVKVPAFNIMVIPRLFSNGSDKAVYGGRNP